MRKILLLTVVALLTAAGAWAQDTRTRVTKNVTNPGESSALADATAIADGNFYLLVQRWGSENYEVYDHAFDVQPQSSTETSERRVMAYNKGIYTNLNQPNDVWILEMVDAIKKTFRLRNAYTYQYMHKLSETAGSLYTTPVVADAAVFQLTATGTTRRFRLLDTTTNLNLRRQGANSGYYGTKETYNYSYYVEFNLVDVTNTLGTQTTQYKVTRTFKYNGENFKGAADRTDEIWVDADADLQAPEIYGLYNESTTAGGVLQDNANGTYKVTGPVSIVYTYEDNPNEPFPFTTFSTTSPRWYAVIARNIASNTRSNMVLNSKNEVYNQALVSDRNTLATTPTLKWAFQGDPINGFYMWNQSGTVDNKLKPVINSDADRILHAVNVTVGNSDLTPFFIEKNSTTARTFSIRFDDKVNNVVNNGDGVYLAKNTGVSAGNGVAFRSWFLNQTYGNKQTWSAFQFVAIDTLYSNEYKNKDYVGGLLDDKTYNDVRTELIKAIDNNDVSTWENQLDNLPKIGWELGAYYWVRSAYSAYNDVMSDFDNETGVYVWENKTSDLKNGGYTGQPCLNLLDKSQVKYLWQATTLPLRTGRTTFDDSQTTIALRAANLNKYLSQCGATSGGFYNYVPLDPKDTYRNGFFADDLKRAQWKVRFNRVGVNSESNDEALRLGDAGDANDVIAGKTYDQLTKATTNSTDRGTNFTWYFQKARYIEVNIPSRGFTTAYYPFAVTIPEYVDVWVPQTTGTAVQTDRLEVISVANGETVKAGTPMIIIGDEGSYEFNINTGTGYLVTDNDKIDDQGNGVKGTTMAIDQSEIFWLGNGRKAQGTVTVRNDNVQVWPDGLVWKTRKASTTIPQNKVYILKSSANSTTSSAASFFGDKFDFDLGDTTTGIDSVTDNNTDANAPTDIYYNLDGTRATKLEKGKVYVNSNGKKYFIL